MEYNLVRNARKFLTARGAYEVNTWGTSLTGSGVPDLLVCYKGAFVALECKDATIPLAPELTIDNDKYAEPPQQLHLKKIRKAGGIGYVVNSIAQVEAAVRMVDELCKTTTPVPL